MRDVHLLPVAADARHGSYCPKMCTYACPVTSATGRDEAVPWGFHRVVADLAEGRLEPTDAVAERLTACSGCLACRVPCVFDQDVPAQIRAGRAHLAAAGVVPAPTAEVVAHVAAGRTPEGAAPLAAPAPPVDATVCLVTGCRDDDRTLTATLELLQAAGDEVRVVVPAGCCGALLDDLGALDTAVQVRTSLGAPPEVPVVASDPHCLPSLRTAGWEPVDLATHLDVAVSEGRLVFASRTWSAVWHDPCVLARVEGVTAAPRRLLRAAGADLGEADGTGCSGAGLGLDLLDPDAAQMTAQVGADRFGGRHVVTGCERARRQLAAAGADVADLATVLAARLDSADSAGGRS